MPTTAPSSTPPAAPVVEDQVEKERQWRWRVSLHEGIHATVAAVLAREAGLPCAVIAIITEEGGATAYPSGEFAAQDKAVVLAAGDLGSRLRVPPPAGPVPSLAPLAEQPPPSVPAALYGAVVGGRAQAPCDAQGVRNYCCARGGPAVWNSRWNEVHRRARALVREHLIAIVRIAEALYKDGIVRPETVEKIIAGTAGTGREAPGEEPGEPGGVSACCNTSAST